MCRTKLALPETTPDQRVVETTTDPLLSNSASTFTSEMNESFITEEIKECEPIIEMPASPEPGSEKWVEFEEPESTESIEFDAKNDEEFYKDDVCDDIEDILTINLSSQECLAKTCDYSSEESEHDMNTSTALVALPADAANIPLPKMKNVSRLKTERLV